jgi:PGF-pre-PGF domain-containing protein
VRSVDNASNVNATSVTITVDTGGPVLEDATLSDATDANGVVKDGDQVEVAVNATDAATTVDVVTVDASQFGTSTVTLTHDAGDRYNATFAVDEANAAADGDHALTITAIDDAGNENATATNDLTLDTTPPTTQIETPADGAILDDGVIRVNATTQDVTSGATKVEFDVDSNGIWRDMPLVAGNYTNITDDLTDGDHTIRVRATDKAGNLGPTTSVDVTVDTVPPAFDDADLDRNASIPPEAKLNVTVNATDDTTSVAATFADGVPLANQTGTWRGVVEASPAIGDRSVTVVIRDAAGNTNPTTLPYSVGRQSNFTEDNGTLRANTTDQAIRNVAITLNNSSSADNETVFVGTSLSNPTGTNVSDDVGLYFPQVNTTVDNDNITDASFTVEVSKSRFDATNADRGTVKFWVHNETAAGWNATTGTLVEENGTHLTYEIDAPHFSTFAISAEVESDDGDDGSGGGGGGGSTPPPSLLKDVTPLSDGGVEVTIQNGLVGRTASLYFDGIDAGSATFDRLRVTYAYDLQEFAFEAHPSADAPGDTPAIEGVETLGYLTVDTAVQNGYFESVEFRFDVPKSALPEGATLDDVALYRYDGSDWTKLDTSRSGTTFEATSPGFSVFAVGVDAGEADLAVTGAELSATELAPGETVEVTATVENDGRQDGTAEIALTIDGETVATETVTVAAGESTTVTFTHAFDAAGDYEIAVEDASAGSLSVQDDETTTLATTTEAPGGDDDGIGAIAVVVVVFLVILAVAAVYLHREGYFESVLGDDGE